MRASRALLIATVRNYSGVSQACLNCSQETPLQEWIWRGSQMCRREEETHLRHISPVSVILGCQILVKHFTLGGCNTEKGHKSPNQHLQCKHVLAHAHAHTPHIPRSQTPTKSPNCYAKSQAHTWPLLLQTEQITFSVRCVCRLQGYSYRPGLVYFILYLHCMCTWMYVHTACRCGAGSLRAGLNNMCSHSTPSTTALNSSCHLIPGSKPNDVAHHPTPCSKGGALTFFFGIPINPFSTIYPSV